MPRAAVLVVRVWKEGGGERIVARITSRPDSEEEATDVTVVGSYDDIMATTGRWLQTFLAT
jgi:hypothetical protein